MDIDIILQLISEMYYYCKDIVNFRFNSCRQKKNVVLRKDLFEDVEILQSVCSKLGKLI